MADIKRTRIDEVHTDYAAEDGKIHITTHQSVDKYIRQAQDARAEQREHGQYSKVKHGMFKAAEIPEAAILEWKIRYGFDWFNCTADERKRWLYSKHCAPYRFVNQRRR